METVWRFAAARVAAVGGHTIRSRRDGFVRSPAEAWAERRGSWARIGGRSADRAARGACIARITSALRSHLPQAAQSIPSDRLSEMRWTRFGPAQAGQTNGIVIGAGDD